MRSKDPILALICIVGVIAPAAVLLLRGGPPSAPERPLADRSQWVDPKTGCVYFLPGDVFDLQHGLTPRYGADGKVMGCGDIE